MIPAEMEYDAFLSFRSNDQEELAGVAEFLKGEGLRIFFSPWCIKPGENWLDAVEAGIRASRHCVVFLGGPEMGDWQKLETGLALLRQQKDPCFRTIPVLLSGIQDSDIPLNALDLHSRIDFRQDRDQNLNILLGTLKGTLPNKDGSTIHAICPYRDLKSYREEDASAFFGREKLIDRLEDMVCFQPFTVLLGESGSGKTSLVQAGLLPRLRNDQQGEREWIVVTMQPGKDPLGHFCSALASWLSQDPSRRVSQALEWKQRISGGTLRLSALVQSVLDALRVCRMLLVVDPGEELWTWASPETSQFLEEIFDALNPLSVLLVLRADYYGRALAHPVLGPRLAGRTVPMTRMDRICLERTIRNLAKKGGLSFGEALVKDLVNELEQAPAGLPLLQRVMKGIWLGRDRGPGQAFADLKLIPGVAEALAEEALPEPTADREAARRLFLRLVNPEDGGTRATPLRIFWDEISPAFYSLVESLVETRVVVVGWDKREKKSFLELGHDELAQSWNRMKGWVNDDQDFLSWRQKLRRKRRDWEQGGHAPELLLLDKIFLEESQQLRETRAEDLVDIEKRYIEKSSEEYRRRRERKRWAKAFLAIFVIAVLGVGIYIANATRAEARSRSVTLAAEAARLADRKLDLALLLALHAGRITETAEARGVALTLAAGKPALRYFLDPGSWREQGVQPAEVQATAFGPGNLIATGGEGKIFLWDAKAGALSRAPLKIGDQSLVVSLAFSPAGSLLAASSEKGGVISLWDLGKSQWLDPIRVDGAAQNLIFDSSGRLLAWSTSSGIHLWDVTRKASVKSFSKPSSPEAGNWISDLAFGPSGELVAATAPGEISLGGKVKGWQFERLVEPAGSVLGLAFLPDGTFLSAGNSVQRWDLGGKPVGQSCSLLLDPEDEVISVAFSQDRSFVASGHLDRKIRLWEIAKEGCPLFTTLSGHSGLIWAIAFGEEEPGGMKKLVSGGEEGDLILWETAPRAPAFFSPLEGEVPRSFATVAVSPDGNLIAVGDSEEILDLNLGGDLGVQQPACLPSGMKQGRIAQGRITLFDGQTRKKLTSKATNNQCSISRMAFSGNGRLATGGPEGEVLLWKIGRHGDLESSSSILRTELRTEPRKSSSEKGSIRSLAFSQDGVWIAAGTDKGWLLVWKPENGTVVPTLAARLYEDDPILAMAFVREADLVSRVLPFLERRQEEYLVVGGADGKLTLWDLEKSRRIGTESAHSQTITSLAARADGLLASGSLDRSVRLWRLDQGLNLEDTLFLGWRISDLDLSHQGDLLAAAGEEGARHVVGLWDLNARLPLGTELQALSPIRRVVFNPQGQALFLGGQGVSAWWDLRPETWVARACDIVRRGFYPVERETYLRSSEKPEVCPGH